MGKSPAFQLYASDFDMDTASWNNDEVGIYFRLLMYQWVNGSVPSDVARLAKIARMSQKKFQNRWKIISGKFKENGNNGLINQRMEKTRQKQDNYMKSQSDAGKRGVEIKREKGIYPFKQPFKQPLKQPCKPEPSSSSSSSSKNKYTDDFLLFYNPYPIKKSKDKAFKYWKGLKRDKQLPELNILLNAIQQQSKEKEFKKSTGAFCPEWKHPSTWLNEKCWEDEVDLIEPQPEPKQESIEEQCA